MTHKYIGYIRVSDKRHDTSIPAQKSKLIEYAKSNNLPLTQIFVEERSAFRGKRKEFDLMLKELAKENIRGVIFHKVDRSSRNTKDFARLEEFFDRKEIVVIEGEFDTNSAQGRFMFRMFCNMAVWYSENLSEEICLKIKERLKKGYYPRMSPFGYRKGEKTDADPLMKYPCENAVFIKEMFQLYDTGNYNYRSLAKEMRARGWENCNKSKVDRMLCDHFYYGMIKWNHRKLGETNYYVGNHEPLISKELYDRVQNRRHVRSRYGAQRLSNPYSLFFTCTCGKYLYWERPKGGNGKYTNAYLRCQNKECSFTSLKEEIVTDEVVKQLQSYILRLKWIKEAKISLNYDFQEMEKNKKKTLLNLDKRMLQIQSQINKLEDGFLSGVFDASEVVEKKSVLKEEKSQLELKKMEIESNNFQKKNIDLSFLLNFFKTLASQYLQGDSTTKKQILELCFSNGFIKGKKPVLKPSPEIRAIASFPKTKYGGTNETILEKHLDHLRVEINSDRFWSKVEHFTKIFNLSKEVTT